MVTKEGPEAHWLHGSAEPFHLTARGERHAILQATKEGGYIPVDPQGSGSTGRAQKIPNHPASPQATQPGHCRSASRRSVLYISCTTLVVSTALVVERAEEGHAHPVQHPVYFISEVLGPSKIGYPQVQKLLYAVLLTARKLRHYFNDHKVIVVTGFLIGDILCNREAIGRTSKWACELGAHDIDFRPCMAIKTQALVDFISEWTEQQIHKNPESMEV
jgi:hypothetical protein